MAIQGKEVKQLCTKSELALYQASLSRSIKRHDRKELDKNIALARNLRDKYRGLANRQRRESRNKQQPKSTKRSQGNLRTRRKQELFSEVLQRFQAQKKLVTSVGKTRPTAKSTKKSAVSATSKKPKKKAATKKAAKKSTKKAKKSASKKTTKKKAQLKKTQSKKPAAAKKTKPKSRKTATAKKKAKKKTSASHVKTTDKQQLKATTAAKKTGFKKAGQVRTRGHISSRGRRRQAVRDNR